MKNKETKLMALFFVIFMVSMTLVGSTPMIMADSTDGGGSYNWTSSSCYPNSAFSAYAYKTGSMGALKVVPGSYGRVDSHLVKEWIAPADGYVVIKLTYSWNWYTDIYRHVYLGTAGLKNPSGQYESDKLVFIDPFGIYGPVASDSDSGVTYMHAGSWGLFIPVDGGVRYTLSIDLTIESYANAFHKINYPSSSATFTVTNKFTFYSVIP